MRQFKCVHYISQSTVKEWKHRFNKMKIKKMILPKIIRLIRRYTISMDPWTLLLSKHSYRHLKLKVLVQSFLEENFSIKIKGVKKRSWILNYCLVFEWFTYFFIYMIFDLEYYWLHWNSYPTRHKYWTWKLDRTIKTRTWWVSIKRNKIWILSIN